MPPVELGRVPPRQRLLTDDPLPVEPGQAAFNGWVKIGADGTVGVARSEGHAHVGARAVLIPEPAGAPHGALQRLAGADSASPFSHLSGGYHDVQLDGHAWRLFLLHDREDDLWILLSERGDVRGEVLKELERQMAQLATFTTRPGVDSSRPCSPSASWSAPPRFRSSADWRRRGPACRSTNTPPTW